MQVINSRLLEGSTKKNDTSFSPISTPSLLNFELKKQFLDKVTIVILTSFWVYCDKTYSFVNACT
jgi:hypothetical protein